MSGLRERSSARYRVSVMGSEQDRVALSDAVLLQRGFDLPAYVREAGEVPVVASKEVVGFHSVAACNPPGVVIGRSGAIGGGQWLTVPYWPLNTTLWVKDFRGNEPRFIYYLLRSIDFTRLNAGSGVPTLNRNHLNGTLVWLPDPREQRRIAVVLGALDEKIESSRGQASLLEEIAGAVFQARFVDFARVEEFEESEHGRIPRGWHSGYVSGLCETRYGYTASATDEMVGPRFLRVKDINKQPWIDWSDVPYCLISEGEVEKYALRPGDIVVARMADPGKVAIVNDDVDAVCASYLVRLRTHSRPWSYFVHRYLRSPAYDAYLHAVMGGSVQRNINARVLVAAPLAVPPDDVVQSFAQLAAPLYDRQASTVRECAVLAAVRDALLPKLISGQIRIPDTADPEEAIGRAAEELAGAEA
jgi:type I restriction enzyme S subunit